GALHQNRAIADAVDFVDVFADFPDAAGVLRKPDRVAGFQIDRCAAVSRHETRAAFDEVREFFFHDGARPAAGRAFPDAHAVDARLILDVFASDELRGRKTDRRLDRTELIQFFLGHAGRLADDDGHAWL